MNYLFPFQGNSPQHSTFPAVKQNVLNGKERDNTWLQLPVCPNLTRKTEENTEECPADAKCRANYGKYYFLNYNLYGVVHK